MRAAERDDLRAPVGERGEDASIRSVALELAASRAGTNGERPYGCCPYLAETAGVA